MKIKMFLYKGDGMKYLLDEIKKSKWLTIVLLCIICLISVGAIGNLIKSSNKYAYENMMPGQYGLGYLFGDGTQATSAIVNNATKEDNKIMLDLEIPFDGDSDFYYYLFSENKEVEFWGYNTDGSKIKDFNVLYTRNKNKDSLKITLESNHDLSNVEWVRIFGLNTDKNMYEKSSLSFKIK
ncbi:MAG: hypothetical protein ACLTBU_01975 [Zhenhengia sp.]